MSNSHLRLVSGAIPSKGADEGHKEWGIANAQQLDMFDEFNGVRVAFVPVANVSYHCFIRALDEKSPYLIVDTRPAPEFFSIFISSKRAFEEFSHRKIEYCRVPLQDHEPGEILWRQIDSLNSILTSHIQKNTTASIFVLSSTNFTLGKMSKWLKGYISKEVSDARFEEISG